MKHFIIAANLGHDGSTKSLREFYEKGHVSKKSFDAALRAYQAAVNETKSPSRLCTDMFPSNDTKI